MIIALVLLLLTSLDADQSSRNLTASRNAMLIFAEHEARLIQTLEQELNRLYRVPSVSVMASCGFEIVPGDRNILSIPQALELGIVRKIPPKSVGAWGEVCYEVAKGEGVEPDVAVNEILRASIAFQLGRIVVERLTDVRTVGTDIIAADFAAALHVSPLYQKVVPKYVDVVPFPVEGHVYFVASSASLLPIVHFKSLDWKWADREKSIKVSTKR